jgi:hypothetical protein
MIETTVTREKVEFRSGGERCVGWHYPGTNGGCVFMAGGVAVPKEPASEAAPPPPRKPRRDSVAVAGAVGALVPSCGGSGRVCARSSRQRAPRRASAALRPSSAP